MSAPVEHRVKCPSCGLSWRTIDTSPTLYCRKCGKWFPNPYAAPEAKQ
ncbi:MAG: hypothetical protein METHP_01121 [Methanoregula sp. SKADARSKE-2]|nr:MAG: hypothetical protein METHP_01121 [Methanoregula sp. SKADARSKE-2]